MARRVWPLTVRYRARRWNIGEAEAIDRIVVEQRRTARVAGAVAVVLGVIKLIHG